MVGNMAETGTTTYEDSVGLHSLANVGPLSGISGKKETDIPMGRPFGTVLLSTSKKSLSMESVVNGRTCSLTYTDSEMGSLSAEFDDPGTPLGRRPSRPPPMMVIVDEERMSSVEDMDPEDSSGLVSLVGKEVSTIHVVLPQQQNAETTLKKTKEAGVEEEEEEEENDKNSPERVLLYSSSEPVSAMSSPIVDTTTTTTTTTVGESVEDDVDVPQKIADALSDLQEEVVVPPPMMPDISPKPVKDKKKKKNKKKSTSVSFEDSAATMTTTTTATSVTDFLAGGADENIPIPTCLRIHRAQAPRSVSKRLRKSENGTLHRQVSFHKVQIRRYAMIAGDNPSCQMGAPVMLDWGFEELPELDLDDFELTRCQTRRTKLRHLLLNYFQRRRILLGMGYSEEEMKETVQETNRERFKRSVTRYFLPISQLEEAAESLCRKVRRIMSKEMKMTEQEQKTWIRNLREKDAQDSISRTSQRLLNVES